VAVTCPTFEVPFEEPLDSRPAGSSCAVMC
jgi:hypothetical protein